MIMNDEKFELTISDLAGSGTYYADIADELRARDTAQREALAQMKTERDQYDELHLESIALAARHEQALARVEADREFLNGHSELIRLHASKLQADLDTAQAQLAEAVGLLHEFAAAQEAKRQGVSNAQRAAGISRLVVVEERVVAFLARHAQAEQQEALSDAELMEVAMFERSGNKAARRASFLGAAELPEHPAPWQEAQDAQAGDERSTAEQAYVADAFDYSAAPIGSRDWTLYWKGWQARAALATQPAAGTTSDQYRAELYDEVWQKARDMGYGNVTDALVALERMKATQPAAGEPVAWMVHRQHQGKRLILDITQHKRVADSLNADRDGEWTVSGLVLQGSAPPAAATVAPGEPVAWECYEPASEWNGYKGREYLSREKPKGCSVRAVPLGRIAAAHGDDFQARVQPWMLECFGEMIAGDREERNHRFLEEALELVQSTGCTASEAHQLVDYVFGRPVGEPAQEVGGVMVTLAALCLANSLDMHDAAEVELARIWTKVEAIRAKQAAKPKHSPLPEAAAHEDEAVRKDAEAAYVEMTCQPVLIDGAHHYYLSSERMQAFDRLFSVDVSNAAMRAQADGGEA